MLWDLAHRTRDAVESTPARVEAASSLEAIEKLRSEIPADHLVLFVRRAGFVGSRSVNAYREAESG